MALACSSCANAEPDYASSKRRRLRGKQANWRDWPLSDIRAFLQAVRQTELAAEDKAPFTYDCKPYVLQMARRTASQLPWHLVFGEPRMTELYQSIQKNSPVSRVTVSMLLDDMGDFASRAEGWHRGRIMPKARQASEQSTVLMRQGDWRGALERRTLAIEICTFCQQYTHASDHCQQAADILLAVRDFDAAEALGQRMLEFPNGMYGRHHAGLIVERAQRRRRSEFHYGASVRMLSDASRPDLGCQIGEIRGPPGASTGDPILLPARHRPDMYEVIVGETVHAVHAAALSLVTVVVQVSLCATSDGYLTVKGTTMNGGACGEFVADHRELTACRLLTRFAQLMGKHASNLKCVMPDAICVDYDQNVDMVAYKNCLARAAAEGADRLTGTQS